MRRRSLTAELASEVANELVASGYSRFKITSVIYEFAYKDYSRPMRVRFCDDKAVICSAISRHSPGDRSSSELPYSDPNFMDQLMETIRCESS